MKCVRALLIHPSDNVAVALDEIPEGAAVQISVLERRFELKALQHIPFTHKIAVRFIAQGDPILKYGATVAFATADIAAGSWVHGHNAASYEAIQQQGRQRL